MEWHHNTMPEMSMSGFRMEEDDDDPMSHFTAIQNPLTRHRKGNGMEMNQQQNQVIMRLEQELKEEREKNAAQALEINRLRKISEDLTKDIRLIVSEERKMATQYVNDIQRQANNTIEMLQERVRVLEEKIHNASRHLEKTDTMGKQPSIEIARTFHLSELGNPLLNPYRSVEETNALDNMYNKSQGLMIEDKPPLPELSGENGRSSDGGGYAAARRKSTSAQMIPIDKSKARKATKAPPKHSTNSKPNAKSNNSKPASKTRAPVKTSKEGSYARKPPPEEVKKPPSPPESPVKDIKDILGNQFPDLWLASVMT